MNDREMIDFLAKLDDLFYMDKPTPEDVEKAQNDLGLRFAEDYKTYVSVGGAICGGGIELTGVTRFDRLNVVKVTQKERLINSLIPDDMYVVEVIGIDGMIVLQDVSGTIYTAQPYLPPKKLFDSLIEYIENLGRFTTPENASEGYYYEDCDEFGQDLLERMENGLIPLLPNLRHIHLHHMGLSQNIVTDLTPLVEFKSDYYFDENNLKVLFGNFDGENEYDRIACIRQKQNYWNIRSKMLDNR